MARHTPIAIEKDTQNTQIDRRKKSLGASEIPTLFARIGIEDPSPESDNAEFDYVDAQGGSASPYSSPFELAMLKLGHYTPIRAKQSRRQNTGRIIERSIIRDLHESYGLEVIEPAPYYLHPTIDRLGAQIDTLVKIDDDIIGVEIKLVDINESWKWYNEAAELVVPAHIQLQCQQQMDVLGTEKHLVAVQFGLDTLHLIPIERDDDIISEIHEAVQDFWRHIDAGHMPEPRSEAENKLMAQLYYKIDADQNLIIDLSSDDEIMNMVDELEKCKATEKEAKERKEVIQEELKNMMINNHKRIGILPDGRMIKITSQKPRTNADGESSGKGSSTMRIVNAPDPDKIAKSRKK